MTRGQVNARGDSALPDHLKSQGVHDLAALGDNATLSAEMQKRFDAIQREVDAHTIKAKYKLEVVFGDARSVHRPFVGIVSGWTNGGYMNGGGDEGLYFCPQEIELDDGGKRNCAEPITPEFRGNQTAICKGCRRATKADELAGQVIYKLTYQDWVGVLLRAFSKLEMNADLRIGYFEGDIIQETHKDLEKTRHGDDINKNVRNKRLWATYSLKNILRDTSTGRSLESLFRAFLLS